MELLSAVHVSPPAVTIQVTQPALVTWGGFLLGGKYSGAAGSRWRKYEPLKLNLMVSANCKPTSALRIQRSSESSIMDCHDSQFDGTAGTQDWPDRLRAHAAIYREIAERADDPFIKNELLDLASGRPSAGRPAGKRRAELTPGGA